MRTRIAAAVLVIGGLVGLSALPAGADATVCYSASVTVNGGSVVDQTNMPDCTTVALP
ncbi:MAG TPA: hypothetical protein VNA57_05505 [Acidimicrobiales bacterium]|nr:hypothetical protein [Acidimicrobiales bacterium]